MSALFHEMLHATVYTAATGEEAARVLSEGRYDLVLVNRVLAADGTSGVDLIRDLARSGCTTPLMLVSDYSDAQDLAVSYGAIRGFGKADLERPETFELIRAAAHSAGQVRRDG
jgi:DNA-binding response OmpR family regulator